MKSEVMLIWTLARHTLGARLRVQKLEAGGYPKDNPLRIDVERRAEELTNRLARRVQASRADFDETELKEAVLDGKHEAALILEVL